MRITPEHEAPQGGADAVTFSFADPASDLFGFARLGLSGEGGQRRGSALAVLFTGRTPVAAIVEGDVQVEGDAGWEALALPGLAASVEVPLERWSVRMTGEHHTFALTFAAASPPADRGVQAATHGYEQLCTVHGEAVLDGATRPVAARGQRGHSWETPDWTRLEAVHSVSAWMDDERGLAMTVSRERGAKGHDEHARWAALLDPAASTQVADPRLSTTYDGQGRQRRAGLELWLDEEEGTTVHRAAGSLVCGSSLDLGDLRLDCSFMRWTMEGVKGFGRYDVLRRA